MHPSRSTIQPSRLRTRRAFLSLLAAAGLPLPGPAAHAQAASWPARPVRLIVAYPPGGVSDVVARLLAERLAGPLGVPVVVENRAGGSGSIGLDAVAKAPADGHTLGFSAISPLVLSPHLGKSPFDPARDLLPVVSVIESPVLLLGTTALAAADFRGLVAAAKARPGAVRWATSGPASLGHIVLEQVKAGTGADITHIPYKGGGQQVNDALSGQFEVLSVNSGPAVMAHVKAGRLRPLAVGAPTRLEELPTVPTLAELGLPAANLSSLFGLFAPAGTPAEVVDRVNAEVNRVLRLPDVRARILAADNLPTGGSTAEFARRIATESAHNARIIRAAGIRAE